MHTNQFQQFPSAMIANSHFQPGPNSTWIPDSGASFHVTGESQNIQQLGPFEGPDQIYLGNGQGLSINSTGSTFISPTNPRMSLFLSQPLHVPSITKNLIIVSKFALDNCVFFEFHLNHCLVKSQVSNEILLQGSLLVLVCNFKAQLLFQLLALFLTLNDFNSDVNTVSTASTCTCTGSKTL